MYNRLSVAVLLVVLVTSAGCVGVLTGSEPLVLTAHPVSVSDAGVAQAGYQSAGTSTQTLNEQVSAAGQSRDVEVTNHLSEYTRTVDAGQGSGEFARFVVLSTPAVEVFGQTFNPVGAMSVGELVELMQDGSEGFDGIEPDDKRSATVLGTSAEVEAFRGESTLEGTGQTVDVTIDVVRIRAGDDFIVAIAVYPTDIQGESDRVNVMFAGIQHGD